QEDKLAGWASERAAGIETGHRRHLADHLVRTGLELDRVPLGVNGTALGLLGDEQEQVVDGQPELTRGPLPGSIKRQPLGTFHEQVAGVVEGFAERSAPRDDASRDSPGGVGLDPDRHPRVPLASVEHAPRKAVRNGPWVPPAPETMVRGSCVSCDAPQRESWSRRPPRPISWRSRPGSGNRAAQARTRPRA